MGELDRKIAEVAGSQHGVVSRRQLLAAGVTKNAITGRLADRRLHQLHRGVYAVGASRPRETGRYLAAVLACGEGALLSHRCAAGLWGMAPTPSGTIDVTVARRGARPQPGIALHRTRSLHRDDIAQRDRIPCTSPARTLVDLAAVARPHQLERALELAQHERIFDARAIAAALTRARGRPGTGPLRRLLDELPDEPPPKRTELERRFLRLVRDATLPIPIVRGQIGIYEVDFQWPSHRLVVETDGRKTHGTDQAFEEDRRRDLYLRLAGWDVMRFTWRQVTADPERVVAALSGRLRPLVDRMTHEARESGGPFFSEFDDD